MNKRASNGRLVSISRHVPSLRLLLLARRLRPSEASSTRRRCRRAKHCHAPGDVKSGRLSVAREKGKKCASLSSSIPRKEEERKKEKKLSHSSTSSLSPSPLSPWLSDPLVYVQTCSSATLINYTNTEHCCFESKQC